MSVNFSLVYIHIHFFPLTLPPPWCRPICTTAVALLVGLPSTSLFPLWFILNSVVKVIFFKWRLDHFTPYSVNTSGSLSHPGSNIKACILCSKPFKICPTFLSSLLLYLTLLSLDTHIEIHTLASLLFLEHDRPFPDPRHFHRLSPCLDVLFLFFPLGSLQAPVKIPSFIRCFY